LLAHWLLDTDTFANPESLSTFQKDLPLEWIEEVLEKTNKASIRKRGMGLFRDRSITDIVSKLDLNLSDSLGDNVAPSAIPQARQRLSGLTRLF